MTGQWPRHRRPYREHRYLDARYPALRPVEVPLLALLMFCTAGNGALLRSEIRRYAVSVWYTVVQHPRLVAATTPRSKRPLANGRTMTWLRWVFPWTMYRLRGWRLWWLDPQIVMLRIRGPQLARQAGPLPSRWTFAPGIAFAPVVETLTTLAETTTTADPGGAGTSLQVASRSLFSQLTYGQFYIQVQNGPNDATNREIMLVTAGQGTGAGTWTVVRGQGPTSGVAHPVGSYVAGVWTGEALKNAKQNAVGFFNVVDQFQARGDDATDNLTPIQNGITAASGGGKVLVNGGIFRTSGTFTYPSDNITIEGQDRRGTLIKRTSDAIMFDVIGAHAATTTTLTRGNITFSNLTLDGGNNTGWSTPMVRSYYTVMTRFNFVKFQQNFSECVRGLEWWDSYFYDCFFEEVGGRTGTRPAIRCMSQDPARTTTTTVAITNLQSTGTITVASTAGFAASGSFWIAGNQIFYTGLTGTTFTGCTNGTASVNLPTGMIVEDDQKVTTGIGHSADNVNNTWFTNCHWESQRDGCVWYQGIGGMLCNKLRFVNLKCENNVYGRFPGYFRFILCTDVRFDGGTNISMGTLDTTAVTTAPVGMWLSDTSNFTIGHTYWETITNTAATERNFILISNGCSNVNLERQIFTAQSTNKPTVAAVEFAGTTNTIYLDCLWQTNPGSAALFSGTPTTYTLKPKGGTSTSTPGAVATVSIAHGMGLAPTGVSVEAANANARGAPSMYVSVDATNIVLNFSANLTAATSYSFVWMAT